MTGLSQATGIMYRAVAILAVLAFGVQCAVDTRSGYVLYPGIGFYKYHSNPVNWSEALEVCLKEGGHLPILNSEQEAQLLWTLCRSHYTEDHPYCHLGFHDLYLKDNYTTIYGDPLLNAGFYRWPHSNCVAQFKSANNKTDTKSPGCGVLASFSLDAGFYVRECGEIKTFHCEKELWHDYELVSNYGYYKLYKTGKTWGDAWKTCVDDGTDLVVIQSSSEASALQTILSRYPEILDVDDENRIHLGFHKKFSPHIYNTIHGKFLNSTGYFTWDSSEPSAYGECGGLVRNGGLFIGSCKAKLAFFCKHPLIKK